MINITLSMILCVWFDYHISWGIPAAQIRKLSKSDNRVTNFARRASGDIFQRKKGPYRLLFIKFLMEHAGYLCLENFLKVSHGRWELNSDGAWSRTRITKNFAGTGWREYLLPAPPITSGLCWSSGPQPSGLFAWSNIFALYYNLSLCSILRALPRFQVGCLIYWVASWLLSVSFFHLSWAL